MRRSPVITFFLLLLILLTVCFIFGNSLRGAEASGTQSGMVSAFLGKALGLPEEVYEGPSFGALIRMLAHMAEFALLGAEVTLLLFHLRPSRSFYLLGGLACALTAAVDETIQFFVPGRVTELSDLLLDTLGALLGAATVLVLLFLRRFLQKRKSE